MATWLPFTAAAEIVSKTVSAIFFASAVERPFAPAMASMISLVFVNVCSFWLEEADR